MIAVLFLGGAAVGIGALILNNLNKGSAPVAPTPPVAAPPKEDASPVAQLGTLAGLAAAAVPVVPAVATVGTGGAVAVATGATTAVSTAAASAPTAAAAAATTTAATSTTAGTVATGTAATAGTGTLATVTAIAGPVLAVAAASVAVAYFSQQEYERVTADNELKIDALKIANPVVPIAYREDADLWDSAKARLTYDSKYETSGINSPNRYAEL